MDVPSPTDKTPRTKASESVARDATPQGRSYSLAIPLLVACALFMQNVDSSMIATGLPAIALALDEDPLRLNLAITSYLLSLAIFIPVSGWMSDRYGARNVFRAAMLVFTVGSVLSGLSFSLPSLVVSRIIQGMGGAMMVPVGRAVMLRAVPKNELLKAMSFLTMPAMLGPVLGPLIGGFIVSYASWRWIFFVNIPIGLIGALLVSLLVKDNVRETTDRLDSKGFIFAAIGLVGIMFGFETIGRGHLPPWVTGALLVFGIVFTTAYVRHARRVASPIIDLRLLRIPTFRVSVLGGFAFRMANGALPFLLPMMLQLGFGLSPIASGSITFASALGSLTMRVFATPIIRRVGFRNILIGNAVICSLFYLVYASFSPDTPHVMIFGALLIGGFFRSLQLTAANTLGYADISQDRMSRASSFASMAQQLSQSIGVGLGALVLHLALTLRSGETLAAADFLPAFLTVGAISLTSILLYLPLAHEAGAEVSGRRGRRDAPSPSPAPDA